MKSLLQQKPELEQPPKCKIGRTEIKFTFIKGDRAYDMIVRDTIAPEDPYLGLVQAAGFAIQQREPYMGRLVPRTLRDFLIKNNLELRG